MSKLLFNGITIAVSIMSFIIAIYANNSVQNQVIAAQNNSTYEIVIVGETAPQAPQALVNSLKSTLKQWTGPSPDNNQFYFINLRLEDTWAIATLTYANLSQEFSQHEHSHLNTENVFNILLVQNSGLWIGALDKDSLVQDLLIQIPEAELSQSAKNALFPSQSIIQQQQRAPSNNNYLLPWPAGNAWVMSNSNGWHDTWGEAEGYALDFDIVSASNSDILASASGVITHICAGAQGNYFVYIKTSGTNDTLIYGHLDGPTVTAENLQIGSSVTQGQKMGRMWESDIAERSDNCGNSDGTHIHMNFPYKPFTIDNYQFTSSDPLAGTNLYSTNGTIDTTDPIVQTSLNGTAGSNNWYTSNVQFTMSASDSGSGVSTKQYRLNNGSWQPYSNAVSISSNGQTKIDYRATDNSGNTSTIESLTVKIDKTAPTLSHTPNSNTWHTADVPVTMTASDSTSGLASRDYSLDGGATWRPYNSSFSITTNGAHPISFRAIDQAGHTTTKHTVVYLDKTPPQLNSIVINNGSSETNQVNVRLLIDATDSASGIDAIRFSSDNNTWSDWQPHLTQIDWSISAVNQQSHTIYAQVRDRAGWTSQIASDSIQLNLYPERPTSSSYRLCASNINNLGGQAGAASTRYRLTTSVGDQTGGVTSNSASYQLQSGYLATTRGCQSIPEPIIGRIEITQNGPDSLRFNWSDPAASGLCHYDLYQEATPYGNGTNSIAQNQTAEWIADTSAHHSLAYYFYQIQITCQGNSTAESTEIGVFNFALTSGSP